MKSLILLLFLAQPVAADPIGRPTPLRPAAEVEFEADNNVDLPDGVDEPDVPPAEYTPNWALLTAAGDAGFVVGVLLGGGAGHVICGEERSHNQCDGAEILGVLMGGLVGGALAIDRVGDGLLQDGASGNGGFAGLGFLGGLVGSAALALVSPELALGSLLVLPAGLGSRAWMRSIERPSTQVQTAAHLRLRVVPWVVRVGESGTVTGLSILGSSF